MTLLSCCSSHNVNKYLFHSVFRTTFRSFFCCLFVILLLKMTPKQGTKVLSGFSKCKKAVICLVEKIHVLDTCPRVFTFAFPCSLGNTHLKPSLDKSVHIIHVSAQHYLFTKTFLISPAALHSLVTFQEMFCYEMYHTYSKECIHNAHMVF